MKGHKEGRRSAVREAMQRENKKAAERAERGFMPFRFYQPKAEETEIILLDNSMDDAFWRNEHNLQIGGKWGNHEPCISDTGPCPHCEAGSRPALVVFLSCLVLREYKNKKTGKVSKYTKMLLPIKRGQFSEFEKIEDIAMRKYGTLRGVSLLMFRKDEDTSFSTGMPVANDDGSIINDWLDEDALGEEFGHDAIQRDGKVLKKADEDITPYDYTKLFPKPDADEIREEHGIEVPGSRRANRRAEEDDAPSRRRKPRRDEEEDADDIPGVSADDEEEDDDNEEAQEEKPSRGSSRSSRSSRSARPRRRQEESDPRGDDEEEAESSEEEEGDGEEAEEEEAPKSGRASSRRRAVRSRGQRSEPTFND